MEERGINMYITEKKPTRADIYNLYQFYGTYKTYFEYYWSHTGKSVCKDDIERRIKIITEEKKKLGGPIEALCYYAQIPKGLLFNSDGTPKDLNEIEVLDMIMEANYGETND